MSCGCSDLAMFIRLPCASPSSSTSSTFIRYHVVIYGLHVFGSASSFWSHFCVGQGRMRCAEVPWNVDRENTCIVSLYRSLSATAGRRVKCRTGRCFSLVCARLLVAHCVSSSAAPPQPLSMSSCLTHTGSTVWSCRSRLIFSCLSSVVDAFIRLVSCLVRTQVEPFEV